MSTQTNNCMLTVPSADEMSSYSAIAQSAATTPYWQKLGGKEGILSIMLLARELGVSPMLAISGGFNNIQGKIEISGRLMNQLIRQRGHQMKVKLCNNEVCILWGKRKDTGEEMEVAYNIEEARNSGLIKAGGAWTKCPSDMLFWRAVSRLARRLFADCIGGCYVEGELQETIAKEKVETIESIPMDEFKQESTDFPIPKDVDANQVNEYFKILSDQFEISIEDLKTRALKKPEEFWAKFNEWKEKKL